MKKHTPGPWGLFESSDVRPHRVHLRNELGGIEIPKFGWVEDHSEEMLSNARLIAAAPELLEACQLALNYLETKGAFSDGSAYPALLRAIAKAEGRKK